MTNTNISTFRKDLFKFVEQTIKLNVPVNVSTKHGNVVLLSEEDYRGMMETLRIESVPGLKQSILDASAEPMEECTFMKENETLEEFLDRI